MKIFEEVVTVKLRGSFARPLHSLTRTSCTDNVCFSWFSSEPEKSAVPIKMWATMTLEQKMLDCRELFSLVRGRWMGEY